ncbi:MAG: hypothetical protein AMJ79_15210 [Phycisphaerae bacterium SM23_30]|nr:MAG: hypothetical protein AMJ79_15210 [Phycisphaerae bacterium SM23_30]
MSSPLKKQIASASLLLVLLLSRPHLCPAQWYVSQQGHLLDANPRIGSMGINPNARLDALIPRINLYITGNVRAGARFQGFIPYRNVGEFTSTLGSSALSDFHRDSVGIADLSSPFAAPRPYIDPSRSLTGIRSGRVVRTHQAFQPARPAADAVGPQSANFNNRGLPLTPLDRSVFSGLSGSFGLPGLSGSSYPSLAVGSPYSAQISIDPRYRLSTPIPTQLIRPSSTPLPPEDLRIQPQPQTTQEKQTPETGLPPQSGESIFPGDLQTQLPPYELSQGNFPADTWNPWLNQYLTSGYGPLLSRRDFTAKPPASYPGPLTTKPPVVGPTKSGFLPAPRALPAKPVLSPARQTQPEDYLRLGEQLMQQQKYYRAADAFEKALIYHAAGALLAAGEFRSAAENLNQALIQDPKLLETKIDLPALFGDPEKFDRRLEELNRLLEQAPNPTMFFLQGYILFRTGALEQAQNALTRTRRDRPPIPALDHLLNAIKNPDNIKQP